VDAPLGDFFASGHGFERQVHSLMVVNSSDGRSRNSYWRMPFRQSCKITVTNEGRRRVSNLYYHVDWRRLPALAPDTAYFHALYRQALPATEGKPYEILAVQGRGHYVGTVMSVIPVQPGWFGEGDDMFYVDGEKQAGIQGTGSEDYFNDAWSLREAEGPYTGVPVAEGTGTGSRMSAYRWHLADPIPFTRSFRFEIEHKGWTYNADGRVRSAFEERPDLFSSVAYWYQQGIAHGLPEPPFGAARLPQGNARQIEVEDLLPQVKTERGKAEVQREVFWSRDLLVFRGEGPGSRIDLPLEVAEDGRYELIAQVAHAPDYGNYTALLDGKPIAAESDLEHEPGAVGGGGAEIRPYHTEVYVAQDHLLGWPELRKGRHTVTFVCTGKDSRSAGYLLGVDTLVLARIARPADTGGERAAAIRRRGAAAPATELRAALRSPDLMVREAAAWAFTQMAAPPAAEVLPALGDADPVVRGLAALALQRASGVNRSVLEALLAHVRDEDTGVRMAAAEALVPRGADILFALQPLIEAAGRAGEHPHVQRAAANALGAMGPRAAPALPMLRKLEQIPRVRWAAQAAIRQIESK
jgi:hypothetical protein